MLFFLEVIILELSSYIDHTKLGFVVIEKDIKALCTEAQENHFASVCVPPCYVKSTKELLKNSSVAVCTVVGFPFGNTETEIKVSEAELAIKQGADEIDMVINLGALKDKNYDYIIDEITEVRDACKGKILKVIVETSVLTEEELREVTKICNFTYVNFIKTSTGFGSRGASLKDIDIINEEKNELLEIKASGGITTEEEALNFIAAGVTRIGTSSGVDIVKGESI